MLVHDEWDHDFIPDKEDPRKSRCVCGAERIKYDPEAEEKFRKEAADRYQRGF